MTWAGTNIVPRCCGIVNEDCTLGLQKIGVAGMASDLSTVLVNEPWELIFPLLIRLGPKHVIQGLSKSDVRKAMKSSMISESVLLKSI